MAEAWMWATEAVGVLVLGLLALALALAVDGTLGLLGYRLLIDLQVWWRARRVYRTARARGWRRERGTAMGGRARLCWVDDLGRMRLHYLYADDFFEGSRAKRNWRLWLGPAIGRGPLVASGRFRVDGSTGYDEESYAWEGTYSRRRAWQDYTGTEAAVLALALDHDLRGDIWRPLAWTTAPHYD